MSGESPSELNTLDECLENLRHVMRCFDGPLRLAIPEHAQMIDIASAHLQQVIDLLDKPQST